MWLGLSTAYSHHCCLAFYTDHQSVCHSILGCWMFPRILSWRHKPCLLVLPFSTTARNLHLVDLTCCQALAWQLGGMLPHSLTRSASYWLILSQYLAVSQMGQVLKHELVLSCASEHTIGSCALQGCIVRFAWSISTKSLRATVFIQTVSSRVVRGNSYWVCDKG